MGIKFPVDMSMNKICGPVFSDQGVEAVESSVAQILFVMDMTGRGMGDDHVNRFFSPQRQPHGKNMFFHHGFGILIGPAVVPHGAFQAQKIESVDRDDAPVNVFASHRIDRGVANIMVAFDVKQRPVQPVPKKRQILRLYIPAGEDQVHRRQGPGFDHPGQRRVDEIRYRQNF